VYVCYITQTRPGNLQTAIANLQSAICNLQSPHPQGISGDFARIPWGFSGDSVGISPAN